MEGMKEEEDRQRREGKNDKKNKALKMIPRETLEKKWKVGK